MNKVTNLACTRGAERPVIELRNGEKLRVIHEATDALAAANVPIFRRGGGLVRTTIADNLEPDGVRRPQDALALTRASADWLTIRLADTAVWQRWDGRAKALRTIDPPARVASDLIPVCDELPFPPLRAIARHLVPRLDGTLATVPGYDRATRLLLDFDPSAFPPVPDKPSQHDAQAAAERLRHLIRHFPFASDTDRSVALSAFVTAIVRPILPQAPLHGFDAPVPGSGKSLLAHAAAILATGETAPMASVGGSDEETEKRLDASLLAGDPVLVLDNVEAALGGERLCTMLSEPTVRIRRLGASDLATVPCSALVLATGNNLRIKGDVARRALVCRLDPRMERPELRRFDQDLLADARAKRGELVTAILTMVQAHQAAGAPLQAKTPLGGYTDWSMKVREPLLFAGEPDPVDSMERLRVDDPSLATLRALLGAWHDKFVAPATAKEAAQAAQAEEGMFRDAVLEVAGTASGAISTRKLGHYLAKHRDRIVDGLQLREAGHRKHAVIWSVGKVGG